MERVVPSNDLIRWKKVGGGAFYFKNRIIKPGQIFTAKPSDIPAAFKDLCIPLDEIKPAPVVPIQITQAEYTVKPRGKSKTWFDVIDKQGKPINEKALSKEVAENLVQDLLK
jgi:hypothetical protein